jgi:hypothetical protein
LRRTPSSVGVAVELRACASVGTSADSSRALPEHADRTTERQQIKRK